MSYPLVNFLTPFFFIEVGLRLDDSLFKDVRIVLIALAITAVAIIGKIVGGLLAAWKSQGSAFGFALGVAMVPRGEVGLIIAGIGATSGLLGTQEVSIIVLMSFLTTLIAPLLLPVLLKKVSLN
jgi:Kef-type K+ transport system membrane component KefB